ncbi:MAG TPA: type VI secretion system-associated FHA domain protein TagH [Steroidobacteraceae bacterium]|jgi:type VI secretion system FHA domain protein
MSFHIESTTPFLLLSRMILTLEVIGEHATDLGAGSRKVFNAIGGTIGRLPDNDWVFPDPYISGRHALIRYLNGKFFVEDTSTNGVFINSPDNRLSKTHAQPLRSGDVLYIDAYEIRVSIEKEAGVAGKAVDPFAPPPGRSKSGSGAQAPVAPAVPPAGEEDRTASLIVPADDHGTEWFAMNDEGAPPVAPESPVRSRSDKPRAAAAPPPSGPAARRMPAQPTRAVPPSSRPRQAANVSPPAVAPGEDGLQELLEAAGIEGVDPSSELGRTCGEILRIVVGGLMEVLRVRERMKDELRMRGTSFKVAHNNPLKFSANVEDAFHNLLVKRNTAYLEPGDAFADALHDIRDHQTATLAAMRLAFETMLAQFDPNRLQEEFDRQSKKGSILGVPAKLRYWELYREKYGSVVKDADASFRTLFGDEFAKAYEAQLERLKSLNRG